MIKVGIIGCCGRMGKTLVNEVNQTTSVTLVGGTEKNPDKNIDHKIFDNNESLVKHSDVVIDFTTPLVSLEVAELCSKYGTNHVIGTTGFNDTEQAKLQEFAKNSVIVADGNMSIGVNLLALLTEQVAKTLGEDYDIEVLEMHHRYKKDAPSGTALKLGNAAAKGRGVDLATKADKIRDGITGERKIGDIGFATLRGGDVVGDHTVIFASQGDRIELTHKASSRNIFSRGAVRAAIWACSQKHGLYNMRDVIF